MEVLLRNTGYRGYRSKNFRVVVAYPGLRPCTDPLCRNVRGPARFHAPTQKQGDINFVNGIGSSGSPYPFREGSACAYFRAIYDKKKQRAGK